MMLKITRVVLSKQEITLQLDGRITGQWVELFASLPSQYLKKECYHSRLGKHLLHRL